MKAFYLKSMEKVCIETVVENPVKRELTFTIDFNIKVEDQPVLRKLPTNGKPFEVVKTIAESFNKISENYESVKLNASSHREMFLR